MNEKFYSIGRGSLNINGKFYCGLDYEITDFVIEQRSGLAAYSETLNGLLQNQSVRTSSLQEATTAITISVHNYTPDKEDNTTPQDRSYDEWKI